MRVIKFRAKMLEGEWVEGSYVDVVPTLIISEFDGRFTNYRVEPNTIGQFTGVCDKNGREIYEGDIVSCVSWDEYFSDPKTGKVMEHFKRTMYIDFRNGGFKMIEPMPSPMKDNVWDIIYNGDVLVIGNIHENANLLKNYDTTK